MPPWPTGTCGRSFDPMVPSESSAPRVAAPATAAPAPPGAPRTLAFPRGLRYMAVGAFFFSVMSLLVKTAGQRLPSQELVLARSATMLALSWVGLRRAQVSWLHAPQRGLLLWRGIFGFSALSCFYFSIVRLPLADANVFQYLSPAFTAILAALVLGEAMRPREMVAVLASMAGVALVARPSFLFGGVGGLPLVVVGVAVLGAFFSACAYVCVRRLERQDPLVIIFYFSLVGVVGAVPASWTRLMAPTSLEWLILLGIGATTQVAQLYLTKGLQLERAGRASAVGYLQVVFAAIWGMLFFRELPGAVTILGFLFVIGGTIALASGSLGPAAHAAAVEELP